MNRPVRASLSAGQAAGNDARRPPVQWEIIVAAISRLRWFAATLFGLDDLKRKRGQSAGRAFSPIRLGSARRDCCPTAHLERGGGAGSWTPRSRRLGSRSTIMMMSSSQRR
jgi:hypothetical protein